MMRQGFFLLLVIWSGVCFAPDFEIGPVITPAQLLRLPADIPRHPQERRAHATDADSASEYNLMGSTIVELNNQLNSAADGRREGSGPGRLFHFESEGVVVGYMEVLPGIRADRQRGMLSYTPGTRWPVIVRFSNGVGWPRRNSGALTRPVDVRGMTITRLVYDRDKPLEDQVIRPHSILGTNGAIPFGNLEKFLEFARVNQNRGFLGLDLLKFAVFEVPEARIIRTTARPVDTLTGESFFQGHSFALDADHAMKLIWSVPNADQYARNLIGTVVTSFGKKNYLEERLYEDLTGTPVEWVMSLQPEYIAASGVPDDIARLRAERTPVEDVLVNWSESGLKAEPVVKVVLYPQARNQRLIDIGNALQHNPGRVLDNHYPLGYTGWGRVVLYDIDARMRGAIPLFSEAEQAAFREIIKIHNDVEAAYLGEGPCDKKVGN